MRKATTSTGSTDLLADTEIGTSIIKVSLAAASNNPL
jgi:hypothetical protein